VVEKLGRRAFIGRHRELARLVGMLDAAASGAGRTVVVGGDAGVGKTRLVERLAEVVVERARVLEGACLESRDGGVPYAPIVEILRGAVESVPEGHLAAILGPGRAELTRLLPEIAPRALDVRPADGADASVRSSSSSRTSSGPTTRPASSSGSRRGRSGTSPPCSS
jgi:GTPase SAR1 family protein